MTPEPGSATTALPGHSDGGGQSTVAPPPSRPAPEVREGDAQAFAMSPMQKRIWLAQRLASASGHCNVQRVLRLRGPLDVARLAQEPECARAQAREPAHRLPRARRNPGRAADRRPRAADDRSRGARPRRARRGGPPARARGSTTAVRPRSRTSAAHPAHPARRRRARAAVRGPQHRLRRMVARHPVPGARGRLRHAFGRRDPRSGASDPVRGLHRVAASTARRRRHCTVDRVLADQAGWRATGTPQARRPRPGRRLSTAPAASTISMLRSPTR